jgi:arylsulfatase
MDPYERADIVSDQYFDWLARNDFKVAQITSHAASRATSTRRSK